jgi:predicted MFS family arabinose efflux permease
VVDDPNAAAATTGPSPLAGSAWAPFRHRWFAIMASAQFVSNIGGWMQTVGAQWLMISLTTSASYVALVQTAASLPVVLFAVAAGAVGDLVDRRRFLLIAQTFMLAAATALGALALAGLVTPWLLLALIFAVGTGQALTSPTWQTLQPELVDPAERPQAISLGSVNQNLARAVGPALGGIVLAATSAGTVFLINAATFVAVIVAVAFWRGTRPDLTVPREHVGEAIRSGGRYVAASPALRVVLLRAGCFVFFASSIWALLPLTASSQLHLGSGGYGLLLGCVGLGAVGGAALLPRARLRFSPGLLLASGSFGLAGVALVLGFVHVSALVAIALALGGLAWILALSTLSSLYQLTLPGWVKARGMSFYLLVFQGGNAVGSAVLGIAAQHAGLSPTLLIAAAGLALGPLVGLRYRFQSIAPEDLLPAADWPDPHLADGDAPNGPIMVTVEYRPRPGLGADLVDALEDARFSRRRTGASSWRVWRDADNPSRILEQFVVASWQQHLRQHARASRRDSERLDAIRAMTDPDHPPAVTHWLIPPGDHPARRRTRAAQPERPLTGPSQ